MRKTSINLYYNTELDSKLKIDKIKKLGFNEFYTGVYEKRETLPATEQIKYANSLGLKCTMIHCEYIEHDLNDFWLDTPLGEEVMNRYIEQIERHKGLSDNFVVHLNGNYGSKLSQTGLNRIRKILEVCDKCNMNLCIENLYSDTEIPYIFEHISHPKLKICFDTGHRNFLTPRLDVLKDYGQYVSVLHIHDNHGERDEHVVCGEGTIDWEDFARNIAKFPEIVLSAEVKSNPHNKETLIEDQFNAFEKLKTLIAKYEK